MNTEELLRDALSVIDECVEAEESELAHLSERLEDTFRGGYSDPRDVEIFRHGMGTAANCVAAVLAGERSSAPPPQK